MTFAGMNLVSGAADGSITLWDIRSSELVFTFKNAHQCTTTQYPCLKFLLVIITSLFVTNKNELVSASNYFLSIKLWDLDSKQEIHHFTDPDSVNRSSVLSHSLTEREVSSSRFKIVVSNDGRYVIASLRKAIAVFDIGSRKKVFQYQDYGTFGKLLPLCLLNVHSFRGACDRIKTL